MVRLIMCLLTASLLTVCGCAGTRMSEDDPGHVVHGRFCLCTTDDPNEFMQAIGDARWYFLGECSSRYYAVQYTYDWDAHLTVECIWSVARDRIDRAMLCDVVKRAHAARQPFDRQYPHLPEAAEWKAEHIRRVDWPPEEARKPNR